MVSFQAPFSENMMRKTTTPDQLEINSSSKKRKLLDFSTDEAEPAQGDDQDQGTTTLNLEKRSKAEISTTKSVLFDMELHLETPLPLEWQRCLDIQSGQIHFYNTRTHTRTSKDPRRSPEPPHMSLDLELNLPCDSVRKINATDHHDHDHHHHQFNKQKSVSPTRGSSSVVDDNNNKKKIKSSSSSGGGGLTTPKKSLSWLGVDEDDEQQEEMVATVCMRCHMLVMLCKSAPACPNCKFMHPPDQAPPKLFKQRQLSLLC